MGYGHVVTPHGRRRCVLFPFRGKDVDGVPPDRQKISTFENDPLDAGATMTSQERKSDAHVG
jgi:hypothetical protein